VGFQLLDLCLIRDETMYATGYVYVYNDNFNLNFLSFWSIC